MIEEIIKKMIVYSNGSLHDINHFLKVHSFAHIIGRLENLSEDKQLILEISAIVHDIACPMLRKLYGKADGKMQEIEGGPLAREFLKDIDLNNEYKERIIYLVCHHHTLETIDDLDYQVLIEADYLVNACESHYSRVNILNAYNKIFKTDSGKELLKEIYLN